MMRRILITTVCCVLLLACVAMAAETANAQSPQAYGRQWAGSYNTQDWNRFYHYPYVYYPQNFWSPDYYKSSQDMMNRYPPEMRIPSYSPQNQNYYPAPRRYHMGHHFILDVF